MNYVYTQAGSVKRRDILALVVAVFLTRWVFMTEYLVHFDSINFALGIVDYNPVVHQPHPPGYFLYILLGKALNFVTGDPGAALLAISIGASVAAVAFVYMLTYEWFGRKAAIFSGILFVLSPFSWFYGTVALTYIVEFCLVSLIGLLLWHVSIGKKQFLLPVAVVMGIAVGFRQSSILFLAPLCLYAMRNIGIKHFLRAVLVFTVTVVAWFLPMLIASGGGELYFTALNDLWVRTASTNNVPAVIANEGLLRGVLIAITHFLLVLFFYGIGFAAAAPLILMRGLPLGEWAGQKRFTLIWIVPGILFFTFIFITFSNMGYMSVIFPPLFAIIGAKLSKWHEQIGEEWRYKMGLVAFIATVNTMVFLYVPSYMGYQDRKNYENDISLTREALNESIDPANTLVVAMDVYRYGFREAGYYSPDYFVVQHPEMPLASGIKVYAMHNRKTVIMDKIPTDKYSRFVIFPTPRHEYIQEEIWNMFPKGSVSRISKNGYTFIEGPSSSLNYLFPQTVAH